jgi:hypothetical protein
MFPSDYLLLLLPSGTVTPTGYAAGLFGGAYFAQAYFADATGGLKTLHSASKGSTLLLMSVG